MKTVDELVSYMKDKGILFTIISEGDAKHHLSKHNNYFKLTSYRKDYVKITSGVNAGKYENLEFAHLIELARIDTEVRHILLQMALDIEHFVKVSLIKAVEDRMANYGDEDGYKIIEGYLSADEIKFEQDRLKVAEKRQKKYLSKISQNKHNPYCEGLVNRYSDEMPIWAFVELISFGDLEELTEYYSIKTEWTPPVDIKSLDRVRQLRNACAHGNAIINDLNSRNNTDSYKKGVSLSPKYITDFVSTAGVKSAARSKKLSNPRINQIVHLLYVYDNVVKSSNTRRKRFEELNDLIFNRMIENKSYFVNNQLLNSTYDFFVKLVTSIKY